MTKISGAPIEETKKEFYLRLLMFALPIMLQNLLVNSVSFIDTAMIGSVGQVALAAVGLANQMFFLISLFFFGVASGAAIFVAQYWGAQDRESMYKVIGIALTISIGGALLSSLVSYLFPATIMRIFTDDLAVIERGKEYLETVAISYLFTAIVMVFSTALRSTGNSKTPLYTSFIAMSVNIVLNYLLILGKFGFPRMEVRGAALATTIARFVEVVLLLLFVYGRKSVVAAPLKKLFSFNRTLLKVYIATSLPVIFNEILWSLGMTAYKIAYSKMGIDVIASVNVTEAIQNLFFVVLMGASNATAILIGNRIGENKVELASSYAKRLIITGLISGIVLGFFIVVLAPILPVPFSLEPHLNRMATLSLVARGILMPINAINMIVIVGVLRSGGDTRFSMFAELVAVWLIGVPCAFIGALYFKMPIYYLYLFVGLEEIFKLVVGLFRVKSGKWINRLTQEVVVVEN